MGTAILSSVMVGGMADERQTAREMYRAIIKYREMVKDCIISKSYNVRVAKELNQSLRDYEEIGLL